MDLEDKEQDLLKIQIKNENGPSSYQNHHASFMPFESEKWQTTFCQDVKKLPTPAMTITADKGFNYSTVDEAFIAQKKNHFQLTCHITKQGMHQFVNTTTGLRQIEYLQLNFYGVKQERPDERIQVRNEKL